MSDRERWIVYPLLFLAIGASLRDKLFNMTSSKRIVCEELIVVDGDGREPLARIGGSPRTPGNPVHGQLVVEDARVGTITADNYLYRGVPFTPTLRAIFPGVSPADVLRALQQSAQALQGGANPNQPPPQPGKAGDEEKTPAESTAPSPPSTQAPANKNET